MILELRTLADLMTAGAYSSVTSFTLPENVIVGEEVPFAVAGHLSGTPDWPNFAVGIFYIDGPMDEVEVTVDGTPYTLKKGQGVGKYREPRPGVCTTISLDCKIKSLDEGDYTFAALTGYTEAGTFYYDDKVDKSVKAEPAPGWPWWTLALGGGLVGVVIIGGVVAYEERRRMEMLLLAR